MKVVDEAALICDFAETYHIFDYRALPARQAALLACGLESGSRIMRKLSGVDVTPEVLLLATIADAVRILAWQNTEDGMKGRNQPVSLVDSIRKNGDNRDGAGFDTPEEFEAWRAHMLGGE